MRRKAKMVCLAAVTVAACAPGESDEVLAAKIELEVVSAHPDVPLERYARFYARERDGSVGAIYLFSNVGHDPDFGKAGSSVWTSPSKLPAVHDGGCAVIHVRFDPSRAKATTVECGAPG